VSGRPKQVSLSPIAATARFSPTNSFDTNGRVEYDVNGNGLQTLSGGASVNSLRASGNVTFSRTRMRPIDPPNSFLTGSTGLRLREGRVTTNYALSWDLARGYVVSQSIAAAYMAQCCGVKADFQNYNYQPGNGSLGFPADRRFNVSLVLAGLGDISNFFGFGGTGTVR
jgi:hypothetical protein